MAFNVEITSKQLIKPSSPTPPHLQTFKLSLLDQIAPQNHTSVIFFYHHLPTSNRPDTAQSLKQSLSDILTQFYPLAGRLNMQNYTVHCNDSGALFCEARVQGNLMDVIKDPSMDELKPYLPCIDLTSVGSDGRDSTIEDAPLLAVQINLFDCGGIAVAVKMSHKIADAASLINFMNAWAETCRGVHDPKPQTFNLVHLFPPRDGLSVFKPSRGLVKQEKIVAKKVTFDKETLAKLKEKASSSSQVKDPTQVEAVTAFFWRRFIDLARAKGSTKPIIAAHAVNLRPRMDPPLPDQTFGNVYKVCVAEDRDHGDLTTELRNALRKIDGDYVVNNVRNGDELLKSVDREAELVASGEVEMCCFTSWWRFPVYDVDYGFGKPVWVVSPNSLSYKNLVIFMGTRSGDGMEAWVTLSEEDEAEDFAIK